MFFSGQVWMLEVMCMADTAHATHQQKMRAMEWECVGIT